MSFIFDREIAIVATGEGSFEAQASALFRNPHGFFGGWVTAILAHAVESHDGFRGGIRSVQINFLSAVKPGSCRITVSCIKRGASTDFWRVELLQDEAPVAVADMVAGLRKPNPLTFQVATPQRGIADPARRVRRTTEMAPQWLEHYEQYWLRGIPYTDGGTPEFAALIRETDGRPLDRKSIFAMCDIPMPGNFFLTSTPQGGTTVSMATYICADDADIAEAGAGQNLLTYRAMTVKNGMSDQRSELWSEAGKLLATSNQIVFHR